MEFYKEEDFYAVDGCPIESYRYCNYRFYNGNETDYGKDYDQFVLIENSLYPYIRLTKKRGSQHIPCGMCSRPASDGWFANLTNEEREIQCPKIAWGFVAIFLANLRYDNFQNDYILQKDKKELFREYYEKYLDLYLKNHNGLKYSHVTDTQKELDFIFEHKSIIRALWKKSEPLKTYTYLYEYGYQAELDYERYIEGRSRTATNSYLNKITFGEMCVSNEAYFTEIESKIIHALNQAIATIDVCVAWFTNKNLLEKLLEKISEGVKVRVIIYKDGVNKSKGVDLSQIEHKEFRGERGGILHDKFCVIDNVHTICGSYNWTLNAENKNDEDAVFHMEDYKLASMYTKRFNEMWKRDKKYNV